jgi:hypothetical protein
LIKQLGLFLYFSFLTFSVYSQTYTLELGAEKDNSIYSENSNNSNGAGLNIFSGKLKNATHLRRALLKFDITSIPAEAIIQNVKLELYVFQSSQGTTTYHKFNIHKVLSDWGEAGSSGTGMGGAAQTGDATWSNNFFGSSNWNNPGGDYVVDSSATDLVSFVEYPPEVGLWQSTKMIEDVNGWRSNPLSNYGWILIGDENISGTAKAFFSKDASDVIYGAYKPKLTINYTIPSNNRIILNEVNAQKRRIELYNPDTSAVDISNYTLVNGSTASTISGGNISILNGNLLLDSNAYLVLQWPDLGQNDGEVALFNGDTTSGDLIDYVQYGSGNKLHAGKAVTDGVWNSTVSFLGTEADSGKSYSLSTDQSYANGTESNSINWLS